jgi:putative beta-barrel porin BBP2
MMRTTLPALALSVLLAASAAAQDQNTPSESASRFTFGPLGVTPSVTFANVGIDTNVFNEAVDPKRDFTATVTPKVDARLRARTLRLTGSASVDSVYFQKYTSERSTNTRTSAQVELLGSRMRPFASVQWLDVKERPGVEINSRVGRRELGYAAGVDVRIAARTVLVFSGARRETAFGAGETFDTVPLADALDRTTTTTMGGVRLELTPLTSFVTNVQYERDRFRVNADRDSNTLRVMPGFEFSPDALLSGKAFVGYRRFDSIAPDQPDVSGVVSDVTLSYTLPGWTQLEGHVLRDIAYSFQVLQPIYFSLATDLRVTERLFGPVDGLLIAGRTQLAYRTAAGVDAGGRDRLNRYGGGIRFRIGTARLSLMAETVKRRSNLAFDVPYTGNRYYSSLTYGF